MSELDALINLFKTDSTFTYSELFDINPFPTNNSYCEQVKEIIYNVQYNKRGRRILNNTKGTGVYNKIHKLEPKLDVNIRDNGIYMFGDSQGKLLYVGKSTHVTDRIFNRVLNHCVPNFDGQQNTMEIWNEYLIKRKTLRIVVFVGISPHPVADIERRVYTECQKLFGHAPLLNKRIP